MTERMIQEDLLKNSVFLRKKIKNLIKRSPWYKKTSHLNRKTITILNRIKANHFDLVESLFTENFTSSPSCRCNAIEKSIQRALLGNKNNRIEREALKERLERRGRYIGADVKTMIKRDYP